MPWNVSGWSRDPHFRQRHEKIVGDLKRNGATNPERSIPLPPETYHADTIRALMRVGSVVEARPGHFYFNESAAVGSPTDKLLLLLVGVILLVAALLIYASN